MGHISVLTGLSILLGFGSCVKDYGPSTETVLIDFRPEVTITPSRAIMQRGDTLWLEMNSIDSLFDSNTGKRYRVRPQDFALRSNIFFKQLVGIGRDPVGIAPTFRIVEKVGQTSISGSLSGMFKPTYDGSHYRARIGLIPTVSGVTAISMSMVLIEDTRNREGLMPFIKLPRTPQGLEQIAVFGRAIYNINQGKANNFDLYSRHTRAIALEPNPPPHQPYYETNSTFTVEVK